MMMVIMMMMMMRILLKKRMVMCSAVVALEAVAGVAVLDADARGGAVRGPPRRLDASARARRQLPPRGGFSAPRPRIPPRRSEPAAGSSATPAATLSPESLAGGSSSMASACDCSSLP